MIIIKIGGGAAINLAGVADDLAELNQPCILVHGANALRDQLASDLGWQPTTITSASGYTSVLSDQRVIDLQMMAYAGLRNKRIVELCQQRGVNAVGLCGLDGRAVQGKRNRGIRVRTDGKLKIVRDESGKPKSVNHELLMLLVNHGYLPVITVPIVDEQGAAINSENDDVVAVMAKALAATTIVQLIEAPGFLEDVSDPRSVIKEISPANLQQREAEVEGRMKRKLHALNQLFENGAATVLISDGRVDHPIRAALDHAGTVIQSTPQQT
ncbi:MAG: [LysW]-aminoadipate kinase [Planctomycetota bacterium]